MASQISNSLIICSGRGSSGKDHRDERGRSSGAESTLQKVSSSRQKLGCKEYIFEMKIADARVMFKRRSNMLPTVKINFMSERKFADNG